MTTEITYEGLGEKIKWSENEAAEAMKVNARRIVNLTNQLLAYARGGKYQPKTEPAQGTGTILLIDDEEYVIDVTQAMLERLGYRVLPAKTGEEARDIADSFDEDIDLAILDIVLPDMHGKMIYPLLTEMRPNLKVIVCSGYTIDGPAQEILDAGADGFIQKPFSMATLSEKLNEVLKKSGYSIKLTDRRAIP